MTERKLPHETWESFAERKIREAQESGAFDRLPGAGQPIADIDEPLDENWWIRKKLKAERLSLLPPVLEVRLKLEQFWERLASVPSEYELRRQAGLLNEQVRGALRSPAEGPAVSLSLIDADAAVRRWRELRGRGERAGDGGDG